MFGLAEMSGVNLHIEVETLKVDPLGSLNVDGAGKEEYGIHHMSIFILIINFFYL